MTCINSKKNSKRGSIFCIHMIVIRYLPTFPIMRYDAKLHLKT